MKLLFLLYFNLVFADQNGNSFWFCGQFANQIAVPNQGWNLDAKIYYLNTQQPPIHYSIPYFFAEPTFAPPTSWLGGQPSFTLSQGFGYSQTGPSWGLSDMYPFAEIAWGAHRNFFMVYLMGGIPLGLYNPDQLDNLGVGHFSLDMGLGYTYLNPAAIQFSALLGFTHNFINPLSNYKNGLDSHVDYSLTTLAKNWEWGLVGYLYYQLTGDSGAGAINGPNKSQAYAMGVMAENKLGLKEMTANLRGYWDIWYQNRAGGLTIYLVVKFPL